MLITEKFRTLKINKTQIVELFGKLRKLVRSSRTHINMYRMYLNTNKPRGRI